MDNYEKKYKEALEWARKVMQGKIGFVLDDVLEKFPELKESEDERIRKSLIDMLKNDEKCYLKEIAWLEKQGEHANFRNKIQIGDKVTRNQDGVLVNQSQLKRVAKKDEKQGEQKPADKAEPKFKVGDVVTNKKSKDTVKIVQILHDSYCYSGWDGAAIVHSDFSISEQDNWELVEQKPAWSEEDENYKDALIGLINEIKSQPLKRLEDWDSYLNWLKSLKDRVQPKQEWSEEDEYCRHQLIEFCEHCMVQDSSAIRCADWLKSLKDRYTWKPSDEQMKALDIAIRCGIQLGTWEETSLKDLYNDLKKL